MFYGYTAGIFSVANLEKAKWDFIVFRNICANRKPDHDMIAGFRKRF
jgi:hypothetical protein